MSLFKYLPYMWKAVMAYFGSGGSLILIQFMTSVDFAAFMKTLATQGWQTAIVGLIPAILVWLKNNKQDKPVVHSNVAHMGS